MSEQKTSTVYVSGVSSPGGNEKTDELKKLFAVVRAHIPAVTPCPEKDPCPQDGRIRAVFYEGEECLGKRTRVFAYLGFPENAREDAKVPAMVLVHGGGCHAWAPWVSYWVDRGYAAISFDFNGLVYNGPERSYEQDPKYWTPDTEAHLPTDALESRGRPFAEQWYYYFISDIILANSLLRNDPRVDPDRIGLTGISWGGFAAGTVLGYDPRFAFVVPVYGCGFLDATTALWGEWFRGEGISDVWDGKLLLPEVKTPVLWVNGDNDPFFSANCTTACAAACENGEALIVPSLIHGMDQGIDLPEIARYADERCGMGEGNIKLTDVSVSGSGVRVSFRLPADINKAELYIYYRYSPLEYEPPRLKDCPDLIEPWKRAKGVTENGSGTVEIPEGTVLYYLSVESEIGEGTEKRVIRGTSGVFSM